MHHHYILYTFHFSIYTTTMTTTMTITRTRTSKRYSDSNFTLATQNLRIVVALPCCSYFIYVCVVTQTHMYVFKMSSPLFYVCNCGLLSGILSSWRYVCVWLLLLKYDKDKRLRTKWCSFKCIKRCPKKWSERYNYISISLFYYIHNIWRGLK